MIYSLFQIKRYLEQVLMWPFVLAGRVMALIRRKDDNYDFYFFIPTYGLGGAEYVNAKILEALPDKKILLVFTKKSYEGTSRALFNHEHVVQEDISRWTDNKWIYVASFIFRGYFAQRIARNRRSTKIFIGQCNFGYKLTPHVRRDIEIIELIHFFTKRFCYVWMPFVRFLDRRICVTQAEIDKIVSYNKSIGVPLRHQDKFTELRLYVDIPDTIKADNEPSLPLKVYYAGRGTGQKRLWLNFEIARLAKERQLPVLFYYAGNFKDELPEDFDTYARYYGPIQGGGPIYEFIKDKHILLLTSESEGFPVALIEAMHFGIVPVITPVGGMPLVIKDNINGCLLNNEREDTVIQSALKVLDQLCRDTALFRRLSQSVTETYRQNFSKQNFDITIRRFCGL